MADNPDVREYGHRIWAQAETVMHGLFVYFDRMAEQYALTEEERVQAVNRFLGEDMAEWYQDWIEQGE